MRSIGYWTRMNYSVLTLVPSPDGRVEVALQGDDFVGGDYGAHGSASLEDVRACGARMRDSGADVELPVVGGTRCPVSKPVSVSVPTLRIPIPRDAAERAIVVAALEAGSTAD